MKDLRLPSVSTDYLPFNGGLDQVTPPWNVKPGFLREAKNYEIGINGGYTGTKGYERFDGQASPSDAYYGILYVNITGSFSAGDTISGSTSGATAVVVAVVTESPSYLVITKISGIFSRENITVSSVTQGNTSLSYTSKTFDLSNEGSAPDGITFNDDGTKVYVADFSISSVSQYGLSTAYDVETATLEYQLDVSGQGTHPRGINFSDDGTYFYITFDLPVASDDVYQYRLTGAFDLRTASFTEGDSFDASAQIITAFSGSRGLFFKSDGTKMYLSDSLANKIFQYSLSTEWEVNTASYDDKSVTLSTAVLGYIISPDGLALLWVDNNDLIHQYDIEDAWDISTAFDISLSFDTSGQTTTLWDIEYNNDGTRLIVVDRGTFALYEYRLNNPYLLSGHHLIDGASTNELHAQYLNLAADEYRGDIEKPPGNGPVRGVWMLNDIKYAFRDTVEGTACKMYKSSSSGWVEVALGREISFTSGGTYEIAEGDTITGATSAATAVITRVVLESGSFAAGTAAGRLIFASQTGTFQSENLNVGANLNVATIAANSSAIILTNGGSYEFVNHNFGGQAGTRRMYGCDGVNRGFEFDNSDGDIFVPIDTGMTTDTPTHVFVHKSHLFFSFASSAQHSGIGTPYIWSVVFGSGELAVGDTITGFQAETGSEGSAALGIYSRNAIHVLYGASSLDWNLVRYRDEVGAYAKSIQSIGTTVMMDDRGLVTLNTTQAFGNFKHATVSQLVQTFVGQYKNRVSCSCISRESSQYRIFFNDGAALYMTVGGSKTLGFVPIELAHVPTCMFSLEASDGSEIIMFGAEDGFVYQMEKGTSFDGDDIERYLILHFHHSKSIRVNKSYKSCVLEVRGNGFADFDFAFELGYNSTLIPQPSSVTKDLALQHSRWDDVYWDAFYWDGRTLEPSELKLDGTAENISLVIRSTSDYHSPMTFTGALLRFIPRRQKR